MTCRCLAACNELLAGSGLRVAEVFVPGRVDPMPQLTIEHSDGSPCSNAILVPVFCPWCGEPLASGPQSGPGGRETTSTHVH